VICLRVAFLSRFGICKSHVVGGEDGLQVWMLAVCSPLKEVSEQRAAGGPVAEGSRRWQ